MNLMYLSSYDYSTLNNGLMIYFWIGALIGGIIFGAVCQNIGTNKGRKGCFWYGFFFGLLGLIIVLCLSDKSNRYTAEKNKYDSLEKLERLKENGTISEQEYKYERKKLLK